MSQSAISVSDIITTQYSDFLSYCEEAGKVFVSDLTNVDFVAFRSRYGRSREYVAELKKLLATPVISVAESIEIAPSEKNEAKESIGAESEAQEEAPDTDPAFEMDDHPTEEQLAEETKKSLGFVESTVKKQEDEEPEVADDDIDVAVKREKAKPSRIGATDKTMIGAITHGSVEAQLAQILGVNADDFASASIDVLDLSVRATNALKSARIMTICDILNKSVYDLQQVRNLGIKTLKEIIQLVASYVQNPVKLEPESERSEFDSGLPERELPAFEADVRVAIEALLVGEPYETDTLSEFQVTCLEKIREGIEAIGPEMYMEMYVNPDYVTRICSSLSTFAAKNIRYLDLVQKASDYIGNLPDTLRQKRVIPFIRAYEAKAGNVISGFLSVCERDTTIIHIPDLLAKLRDKKSAEELLLEINRFLLWLSFDGDNPIRTVTESIFESLKAKPQRSFEILTLRSEGKTLEELGRMYDVTRERIRQVEKKMQLYFWNRYSHQKYDLLLIISAMRDGDTILYYNELEEMLGEFTPILWSCAKTNMTQKWFYYSKMLDAVVVRTSDNANQDEGVLHERLHQAYAAFPDLFLVSEKESLLSRLTSEYEVPLEVLEEHLNSNYQQSGIFYHKGRLALQFKCEYVLKNRFPAGFKIGDDYEANRFRQYLVEFFGDDASITNRALDAKIGSIGVLCDRGKYIHPDYMQVDPAAIEKVNDYIEDSPRTLLTYGELFDALQDIFAGTQITNRYLLQGALKKYGCRFSTGRDFVRKVESVTFADELEAFVEERGVVHKSEIFAAFTSLGEAGLGQVVSRCSNVFNIDGGYYIHASQFDIRPEDYAFLRKYLARACADVPVNIRTVYEDILAKYPEFMYRNDFEDRNRLFAALLYMFRGEFEFSRPYIAKLGENDLSNKGVLLRYLEDYDSIEIEELLAICEDNNIHYVATSYLCQMLAPDYLRISKTTLMKRELTGVTDAIVSQAVELVQDMLQSNDYVVGSEVDDYLWFPEIDVEWNEFLLESIVVFSKQIPIVYLVGDPLRHPNAVYVAEKYKDDTFESLLIKLLTAEVRKGSFSTKADMREWLREEALIEGKLPRFLERDTYFTSDETGVHCAKES